MTWGSGIAWIVAVAACAVYFFVAATIAAFGDRVAVMRFAKRSDAPDPADASLPLYLSSNALILGRTFLAASLLTASLSVYAGLNDVFRGDSDEALALLSAGLLTIGVITAAQLMAWAFASYAPSSSRRILGPIAGLLSMTSRFSWMAWVARMSRLGGGGSVTEAPVTPEQEVSVALKENLDLLEHSDVPLHREELRMIRGILRMETAKVREIMRPRVDIVAAPANSTVGEVASLMAETGHSKLPIFEGTIDNIVGVVHARDIFVARKDGGAASSVVKLVARPPVFVPESQSLERLLREFQSKRTRIAVVVDEYGGVSGLVAVNDLVEEIIGKLVDEFAAGEPELKRISESEVVVDGAVPIDDINEVMGAALDSKGSDTVAGLVYRELGRVPGQGDSVNVDGLTITVLETSGRRVRQLKISRKV